jgi:hypothetical protein
MASAAPRRFAGDGFDYRRPAGSARHQETEPVDLSGEDEDDDMHIDLSRDEDVIDLTADDSGYGASQDGILGGQQGNNEERNSQSSTRNRRINNGPPRLPRGMDIIIDLDNGEEEWRVAPPSAEDPGSPEIEFISSRTIDPPRRGYQAVFGRSNSEGDEVEFVGSNALPEAEVRRRRDQEMDRVLDLMGDMNGRFTHLRAQVERFNAQVNRTAANFRRAPVVPPRGAMRARGLVHAGFAAPGLLDFDMVGFDMGIEPARATAPAPTYQAPLQAPEGFTRSPEEEGPLMCPNCEEELCVGDGEVKRQVWIVKTCGHVSSSICVKTLQCANTYYRSIAANAPRTDLLSAVQRAKRNPQERSRSKSVLWRTVGRRSRTQRRCSRSSCRVSSVYSRIVFSISPDLLISTSFSSKAYCEDTPFPSVIWFDTQYREVYLLAFLFESWNVLVFV